MEIYLVGGAVRDTLLGLPVKDRDWVVVGATPKQMLTRGFVPVGKDFPVFLHPRTKEEYALARTERSTAPGYKGFAFHAAPDVTLEQDLARRDLTINAIAVARARLAPDGSFDPATTPLEDPFHGQRDLAWRLLRHVTDAFHDDPVRILRVARFAARFADFRVAVETQALMRSMVEGGEADALVAERVWQELARGLMEDTPSRMLQVLSECGALPQLLPELCGSEAVAGETGRDRACGCGAADDGVPADAPGPSAARATGGAALIDRAARDGAALPVRFACLCRAVRDAAQLEGLCARLRAPNDCRDLALLAQREALAVQRSGSLDAMGLLALLERCDALRKPARFHDLLQVCALSAGVEVGTPGAAYAPRERLRTSLAAVLEVPTAGIARQAMAEGKSGPAIGAVIHAARVRALEAALRR